MFDKGLLQKCKLMSHAGEGVNRHDLDKYIHNDNDHHKIGTANTIESS